MCLPDVTEHAQRCSTAFTEASLLLRNRESCRSCTRSNNSAIVLSSTSVLFDGSFVTQRNKKY